MSVDEHTVDLASANAFYRSAPARVTPIPLFLHGVPTSSDIWEPVLMRTGGIALDLPGFGRSDKGGHLDYSVQGLAAAATALIDRLDLGQVSLVGHGWGAVVALQIAAARPELAECLVLISPFAPVKGVSWPRAARIWRTPVLGELAMGVVTRRMFARLLRKGASSPEAWSDPRVAALWAQFDQGTQRAILRLHRTTRTDLLDSLTASVATLVLYGERDPWYGGDHARRVAALVPHATLQEVAGAGHWPWLDRPETIETIATFLAHA